MIKEAIARVVAGHDLEETEMVGVMQEIMGGEATAAQIGAFITALRIKGETAAEITGAVRVMREKATPITPFTAEELAAGQVLIDTCGTGGDSSGTFNVSTTTAFVVAAAGLPVAKHGNRSITSSCGSADVLESLGVDLQLAPEQITAAIRQVGIGFMFAPALHGAMKHAIGPRREIGIRTIFNILGPLTNPAGANVQVMGVYDRALVETLAGVLGRLGSRRVMVVCGEGNVDEITVTGPTQIAEYHAGEVRSYTVSPEDFGLTRAGLAEISGGATAAEAATQLRAVLAGEPGPRRDMVLLNAAAVFIAAGRCPDWAAGVELARELIDNGAALAKLDALVAFCRKQKS
ncbi:anthranilate phosphoribosyltransferase [Desulfurivibrio alkaliphilus]|uniref:Anthranilate phosphoribosyltransferase n=1 Tax=Desulfurivibrio alkaliphilus (strain DSM 19089 / UNIQEM U267 / AHT2) TaxID=589865 RepID=D6YZZ8_DESAT|nr:anthranilate phosphoribosyltransferase [Desulfurivibrio alkaliphilus]ADH85155.1 anthranilate phosphoribosyltransferase [Desulfurivibrio alkaliphilus AHT 2]